jgi:hypothetical protein
MMAIGIGRRTLKASVADRTKRKKVTQPPRKDMDEAITALFQQWLIAFGKTQSAKDDEESVAALARIESRIAAAPAEGLRGIVVKLGLQRFLNEHADAASELAASVYADLIRLTGHDPAAEILAKLQS